MITWFSDPFPSAVLQEQIKNLIISEPDIATSFLNSVLNQLNWAFSEFIGMLQEVMVLKNSTYLICGNLFFLLYWKLFTLQLQNASNRQERVLVESRQLKICSTCFDLTLALLRVLEMVAALAPPVFVCPNQPNSCFMLARLCQVRIVRQFVWFYLWLWKQLKYHLYFFSWQLLCQVLNRASSQDGCFHHITNLEIPGLENVDHFPMLTAVCGILIAILKEDIENFHGRY